MAKPTIYGVREVIFCNEGAPPQIAAVCFSQVDGCLYVHLGGSRHGQEVAVQTHQQRSAPINVIERPHS